MTCYVIITLKNTNEKIGLKLVKKKFIFNAQIEWS